MQDSAFKIYNASAGSGKTFTLAKSYIKILIASKNYDQFKYILAITFTNKAVGEMKERIIEMLVRFSSEKNIAEPHPMSIAICEELSITQKDLNKKAGYVLKHIIHNYGAFDISTIDGFIHRIIRTFAHDLHLSVNFEVELDQDRILNEAVDSLIARAGSDDELTKTLVEFAIEKADDDKSWDISYDLNKTAKLLVSENDLAPMESLKGKTLKDFKVLKSQLSKQIVNLEKEIINISRDTLSLLDECGLQFDDFNRKSLPNHFKNLSLKKFDLNFNSSWQNDLIDGETLYPKRVSEFVASTIENIQPQLMEAFLKTRDLVFQLKLKKGFHKNITPLSVLNAIQNELNTLKEEQNIMLISEFNKIISKEIKDQPTPFIYERLGEKYKHYFIDEFQDTSAMQWENLIPLLDNALSSSNGTAMLVGDAKQAIYRWRGGEAEQFIDLYNGSNNPFQVNAKVLSLDTNYRSAKEIINFNNGFFNYLGSHFFSNTNYAELYKDAQQNSNKESSGYVNLKFLDIQKEDDANQLYVEQVLDTIKHCQDNGFSLHDICILVRKRKEGVAVAKFLSENGIEITSSETLLIKNSDKVSFLDSFLKLLIQPNNDKLKVEVLTFLAKRDHIEDKHSFFKRHLTSNIDDMHSSLETLKISIKRDQLLRLPLYELVEHIIRIFNLHNTSDAYLQFYLDIVLEYTQKQSSDINAFLSYFEKKKESLSVVAPGNMNAVKIMTIHKSKGLEFPIVIFPFADLNIYKELDPKIWFPVNTDLYNNFKTLLLNYNKDLEYFGDVGKQLFENHQSQLELDNINLLYVVLTRAVEQLYIISKKDISSKGEVNKNTYSGMLISYLQEIGKWTESQLSYDFGELKPKTELLEKNSGFKPLILLSVPKEDHNLNIITKSGLLWDTKQEKAIERGNLVHLVLSKIKTIDDIDFAFGDLLSNGIVLSEQIESLKTLVLKIVDHPKLIQYYNSGYEVYNERDIITNSGQILRPDRLNINSQNEVVIIDYKTGIQKAAYKSQLYTYTSVIEAMGYTVNHKFIVYINETIDVIEV